MMASSTSESLFAMTQLSLSKIAATMLTSTFLPETPIQSSTTSGRKVFCAGWQALYVLDLDLAHGLGSATAQYRFSIDLRDRGFAGRREIPSAECDWESIRADRMHHFFTTQYSP